MKHDWKKDDKSLYLSSENPVLLTVPAMSFFCITGQGNPNEEAFSQSIEALYTVSYTLKMLPKKQPAPLGYVAYSVFPLEAVWSLPDGESVQDKSRYCYEAQIRQPDFCTSGLAAEVLEMARKKKPHLPWKTAQFTTYEEGRCVQALHIGPYDEEPRTFDRMDAFCLEHGLLRSQKSHREIYLGNPLRTVQSKLKTLLRYQVA